MYDVTISLMREGGIPVCELASLVDVFVNP